MTADHEQLLPPDDPAVFESLCLDLWRDIWGEDSGAQKNGRSGQSQAGVDVFGRSGGGWVGVQCRQKDGLLRTRVTVPELEREVVAARGFRPALSRFILATTGPRDAKAQERARELTEPGFAVEVWSWKDLRHELGRRRDLLERLFPIYWPLQAGIRRRRVSPLSLRHTAERLFGREEELARLDEAWADPATHLVTLVAWGGVGKTSLVAKWVGGLAARDLDGADYFDASFYSQGTRERGAASADLFLDEALLADSDFERARTEINEGVDGLRRAGHLEFLARGLLTRAWLRSAQGDAAGARADLDEAQEIAMRGPVPLYLADVHLYRARLFHDRAALAETRRLIEKHGYGRRRPELEDLEAMAAEWAGDAPPTAAEDPAGAVAEDSST